MSKLTRLLTVPALTVLAGTGAAYANPDIVIGGGAGIVHYTEAYTSTGYSDFDSYNGHAFRGFTSAAYNFTPVLGAQGDLLADFQSVDFDGTTVTRTNLDGALHLFYRDPQTFLLGGFVQLGSTTFSFESYQSTFNRAYAGIEGQLFLENFTLYGQAGVSHITDAGYPDFNFGGYFATLEARYFLTPDFRIEGHVGVGTFDIYPDVNTSTLNIGASAEYRLPDSPFSLFASYDFNSATEDFGSGSYTVGEHRFMIGAKFNFGSETLLDRDRNGVSLNPVTHGAYALDIWSVK